MENDPKSKNEKKDGMESVRELGKSENKNVKIYKKAWFWIVLILSLTIAGLAVFAGIYLSAQSRNRQAVSDGWFLLIEKNKTLKDLGLKVDSQETFAPYATELSKLNTSIDDKKRVAQSLKYKGQDVKRYENFLNEYGKYVSQSIDYANKIEDYSEEKNTKLKLLSESAKGAANELKSNTKYLKEDLPVGTFAIQETLYEANKAIVTSQLTTKAKQVAQEAATAKDIADKKAVENTAGNFLNAYLSGSAPLLRQYMTEAYQKEYDFNQLTYESRKVSYPASFRILTNQKIEDGKYKVQANVLFKFRDGSGQYTVGYEMNIVYDSASSKWLVNSIKEGSSF